MPTERFASVVCIHGGDGLMAEDRLSRGYANDSEEPGSARERLDGPGWRETSVYAIAPSTRLGRRTGCRGGYGRCRSYTARVLPGPL